MQIPEYQRDVLAALAHFDEWARPMDVGGTDGSHHTASLRALLKKGLVERRLRGSLLNQIRGTALYDRLRGAGKRPSRRCPRGSYEYRITDAGRKVVA